MKRIIIWILNHKKFMFILYGLILIGSIAASLFVSTNYNMADYLPDKMESKVGIDVLTKEYGNHGTANILLKDLSIQEILQMKKKIVNIPGVDQIVWLDDVADLKQPLESLDQDIVKNYYSQGYAYMQVIFEKDDYSTETKEAISDIQQVMGDSGTMSGPAMIAKDMVSSVTKNIKEAAMIAIPVIILLLVISTQSYFEVILFLLTIGVAILINNGTNILFGEISFMTASASSLLQMAIAMDYSIFLLHRFAEERKKTPSMETAMINSVTASLTTVSASAITTIIGFLALTLMSFKIGMDLGLVLAKGIFISLICVLTLLPVLTMSTVKLIEKTTHKDFLPSFHGIAKVFEKGRIIIITLIILIAIPAFLGQLNNSYIYGNESSQSSEVTKETDKIIEEVFSNKNAVVVMLPKGDSIKEKQLADALNKLPYVNEVQGIYSYVDPTTSDILIPTSLKDQFLSDNYTRYIVNLTTAVESEKAFGTYEDVKATVSSFYDEYYITGATPSTYDIMKVGNKDYNIVTLVSVIAVGLVLLITFRSISLPILLLLTIEISIWINMSVPYFMDTHMLYLGFLIVSALQLGATIDYAILMTNRYMQYRETMLPKEASVEAVSKAGHSIFTSCTILGTCGLVLGFLFDQATISALGMLIGRGALLSGALVLFILPQILEICDGIIMKTSMGVHPAIKNER